MTAPVAAPSRDAPEPPTAQVDTLRDRLWPSAVLISFLATLATFSNASAKHTWAKQTVSLAAYAGQTVRVQFEATTDGSLPSTFFVDDVSNQ